VVLHHRSVGKRPDVGSHSVRHGTTARKPTLHACVIVPVDVQIEDAPDEAQVNRLSGTVGADDQATATASKCGPG
jgi:hypothetical protein